MLAFFSLFLPLRAGFAAGAIPDGHPGDELGARARSRVEDTSEQQGGFTGDCGGGGIATCDGILLPEGGYSVSVANLTVTTTSTTSSSGAGGEGGCVAHAACPTNEICLQSKCNIAWGRQYRLEIVGTTVTSTDPATGSAWWDPLGGAPDAYVDAWNGTTIGHTTATITFRCRSGARPSTEKRHATCASACRSTCRCGSGSLLEQPAHPRCRALGQSDHECGPALMRRSGAVLRGLAAVERRIPVCHLLAALIAGVAYSASLGSLLFGSSPWEV